MTARIRAGQGMALRASEQRWIDIEGEPPIALRWVRDARARRLSLSMTAAGARLTVPLRLSEATALRFLAEHRDWLQAQRRRFGLAVPPPRLQRGASASLPLWGTEVALAWREARACRLRREGEGLLFEVPAATPDRRLASVLRSFYEAELRARVGAVLPGLLPTLPRVPQRFRIAPLASLWGALSPRDHVSLDLSLVLAPSAMADYVLVHELCHLIQPNHSRAFWAEVAQRYPGWREARRWLRGEGMGIKRQLASLLDAAAD
jgi:predicted metal-dependent hydrolase